MGNKQARVRSQASKEAYFSTDQGCERWRSWARGHDLSAEYDGSSTVIRRSWYGRMNVPSRTRA